MESVAIVDMPSRMNMFGGEERIAGILFHRLREHFNTYYVGFETAYIRKGERNVIMPSSNVIRKGMRKTKASELLITRIAYNMLVVRMLRGIDKKAILSRLIEAKPSVILSNSVQDFSLLRFLRANGISSKMVYIDHGSISSISGSCLSKEAIPLTIGTGINACSTEEAKRKFFGFFDLSVALNKEQYRLIGRYSRKVTYIPNGLSVKLGKNARIEESIRSRYGISGTVVLYVGRMFERQKNVSALIRAFMQTSANATLLLVGEGPSANDYIRLAAQDKRIKFAGSVSEEMLQYFYNIADIFVLPSFWEGFSLTVLEAAAHHLPMLLSSNACIEDLHGFGVPTFSTGSIASLKKELLALLGSKQRRAEAAKASARISNYFTEEKMLNGYVGAIRNLSQ